MSAITINQSGVVWGVKDPLPLKGFPAGRVKLRLRNNDFAQAFVKTTTGIRRFYISESDGFWAPKFEQGSNTREVIP